MRTSVIAVFTLSLYVSPVRLEISPEYTLNLIFLNDHMQYMVNKHLAKPGIKKKKMWVKGSGLYIQLIKYYFRAEILSTKYIYIRIFKHI